MIHDKPFSYDEYLRRVEFLSRPHFFNAIDLNKEMEILHRFIEDSNEKFAVSANLNFTFNSFSEIIDNSVTPVVVRRSVNITYDAGTILFKGVRLAVPSGTFAINHVYPLPAPATPVVPKAVTYIVLRAHKETVTYAQNPYLCGLTSDETPTSVSSVNVEQYKGITIGYSTDLTTETELFCVLGVLHPRYQMGTSDFIGMGFMKSFYYNPQIALNNGSKVGKTIFGGNGSMFEYLTEIFSRWKKVINERQLVRRFNLADLSNTADARKNLGLNMLVNHRQLVRAENLKDLPDKALSRYNLGLSPMAIANFGSGANDVMRGNALKKGMIMMFFGTKSDIPAGWVICDGTNNTPNFAGRFPVGADDAVNDYKVGVTGGLDKVKLTGAQSGTSSHSHGVVDNGHTHDYQKSVDGRGYRTQNDDQPHDAYETAKTSSAKTGISISNSTEAAAKESHENRPPYLAVHFIMYVGVTENTTTPAVPNQPNLDYPNYSMPDENSNGGYLPADYTETETDLGDGIILTNIE